jgi:hypothetical protein
MPRVPAREQQVRDIAMPGVRVSGVMTEEALGVGVGNTIQKAGQQLYETERYYADQAAALEADTKAGQAQIQILQGLRNLRGKDSARAGDYVAQEFGKVTEELNKGLTSDRQKIWLGHLLRSKRSALDQAALHHFSTENERFLGETFKANLSQSIDTARAFADSPTYVEAEKAKQASIIEQKALRLGYAGTEQEVNERLSAHSMTNREVIRGLLAKGDDLRASAYYNHLKKSETPESLSLTAQDRDIVEGLVLEGSTRGQARRTANELIEKHGIETVDQRKAILEGIKGIENDKVADLVRQRVEHEFSAVDQFRKAQAEQNFLNASKMIEETWKTTSLPAREMIPPDIWKSMTPGEQHTLELKAERLRAPVVSHDSGVWFKFKTMKDEDLARLTPAKLMGDYLNHFDKEHYDRALNEYNAAINVKAPKEKKTPDEKFVSALTTRERIRNSFNLSGVAKDPKKLTSEEAIWFDRFETAADKALSVLPKDASPEQIDKVLSSLSDSLLKQKYTVDPGAFRFNKDVPAIGVPDVKDPRSIRVPMKEIPVDRQNALRGALKQAGVPVTEQAVEELEAKSRLKRQGVQ